MVWILEGTDHDGSSKIHGVFSEAGYAMGFLDGDHTWTEDHEGNWIERGGYYTIKAYIVNPGLDGLKDKIPQF